MRARCVGVLAVLCWLLSACKEKEPVAPPPASPPVAPALAVSPRETFVLSNLRLQHDGDEYLQVAYTVLNRSGDYENASLCVDLLDKDGYFVEEAVEVDTVGLSAHDSEEVKDRRYLIPLAHWEATVALRVYLAWFSCLKRDTEARSAALFVDKSGRELSPGVTPRLKNTSWEGDGPYVPLFELKDARLVQNDLDEILLTYNLTNIIQGRASGQLCARLTREANCSCRSLDTAESEEIGMGLSESRHLTWKLSMHDGENWARAQWLVLYMAPFGCMTPAEEAISNVLTIPRPRSIHVPIPREPEHVDQED